MLQVDKQRVGNTLVIRLSGELDMHTAEALRAAADDELAPNAAKNLVLVLSNVTFIDSSGVGAIIGRYRTVKKLHGKMVAVGLKPPVRRVLEMSGVLNIMGTADSERRALAQM